MSGTAGWIEFALQAAGLALALVGGLVGLATYRKRVEELRKTARRQLEEGARSVSITVTDPSTVFLRKCLDESTGLLKRAESPPPPGWSAVLQSDGPEVWFLRQASRPQLEITNHGSLPVRITGVELCWVRYIDLTGKGAWVTADGRAALSLAEPKGFARLETYSQDWTPMSPNRQEKFAPWAADGEVGYTPLPPGETITGDLTEDLRFVWNLHIAAVLDGREEDRELSAIRVEIVHMDLEDAHGLRWRRKGHELFSL